MKVIMKNEKNMIFFSLLKNKLNFFTRNDVLRRSMYKVYTIHHKKIISMKLYPFLYHLIFI